MNLLFLNHNIIWKSTFHRCFRFAKELIKLDHKVTIITNHPKNKKDFKISSIDGVRVVETPDLFTGKLRTGWDPINVVRRIHFLKNEEFDLIHAFDSRPTVSLPGLYYSASKKIPIVMDWGDWWGRGGAINLRKEKILNFFFEPIETFFEEFPKKYADHITVVSPLLKERAFKLTQGKIDITLIPNGADYSGIKRSNRLLARKSLNLPLNKPIIIFSGFVLYDIELVIKALQSLKNQGFPVLLVITGSREEDLPEEVKSLVKADYLKLTGFLSFADLCRYFSAVDLGLLPMKENLANKARCPMKFGDYLSAGLPVVTNHGCHRASLITEYDLGAVTEYKPSAYSKAIKNLLSDQDNLKKIKKNALSFSQKRYNISTMARELAQLYEKLI